MALNINGTTGISGVDGSVSAPALTGTDSNTGITFPAADTIKFSTGGVERMQITNSGVSGTAIGAVFAEAHIRGNSGSPSVTRSTGFGSLTDNGTGDFTLALSTTQADNDYTCVGAAGYVSDGNNCGMVVFERNGSNGNERANTTSAVNFGTCLSTNGSAVDTVGNFYIALIRG